MIPVLTTAGTITPTTMNMAITSKPVQGALWSRIRGTTATFHRSPSHHPTRANGVATSAIVNMHWSMQTASFQKRGSMI